MRDAVAACRYSAYAYAALGRSVGNAAHILFAFRVPRIVSRLPVYPDPGAVAKQPAESNRNRRRDRLALAQDVVEMLP